MIVVTRAIVLSYTRFKESSAIINFYSHDYGKITGILNGVFTSSKKKASKQAFLQSLTLVDLTLYYKPNASIKRIKDIQLSQPLQSIPYKISKSTVALFLAEILHKTILEEERNDALFGFIENAILIFDLDDRELSDFHIIFLFQLSKYLGIQPHDNRSVINRFFHLSKGYYSDVYDPNFCLDIEKSQLFGKLFKSDIANYTPLNINRPERQMLLEAITGFYRSHIDGFTNIKSLDVLNDVFN